VTAAGHQAAGNQILNADGYRDFMSMFPTGVAIVTAIDLYGIPHGMTCTALASVTLYPPTLLVCLNTDSGTLAAIRASGFFAVNLLHSGGRRTAEIFGSAAGERFRQVPWEASPITSVPLLIDVAAIAECRVSGVHHTSDHQIVLGQVISTTCAVGTVPLTYGLRRFSEWGAVV
jgi:flavin reductase (DIM6/NTAB) family NADH-FMN oxidoreductase RutF